MTITFLLTHHNSKIASKLIAARLNKASEDCPDLPIGHILIHYDSKDDLLGIMDISETITSRLMDVISQNNLGDHSALTELYHQLLNLKDTKFSKEEFFMLLERIQNHLKIGDCLLCIDANLGRPADKLLSETAIQYINDFSPKYLTFFSKTPECLQNAYDWLCSHEWANPAKIIFSEDTLSRTEVSPIRLNKSIPHIFIHQDPTFSIDSHLSLIQLDIFRTESGSCFSSSTDTVDSDPNKEKKSQSSKRYPSPELEQNKDDEGYEQYLDLSYKTPRMDLFFSNSSKSNGSNESKHSSESEGHSKMIRYPIKDANDMTRKERKASRKLSMGT